MLSNNGVQYTGEVPDIVDRRQHRRVSCQWQALVRMHDDTQCRATVVDASQGGMRLVCDVPVAKGSLVTIELQNIGRYACEVRWRAPGQFGVQFLSAPGELADDQVEALAGYIRQV